MDSSSKIAIKARLEQVLEEQRQTKSELVNTNVKLEKLTQALDQHKKEKDQQQLNRRIEFALERLDSQHSYFFTNNAFRSGVHSSDVLNALSLFWIREKCPLPRNHHSVDALVETMTSLLQTEVEVIKDKDGKGWLQIKAFK